MKFSLNKQNIWIGILFTMLILFVILNSINRKDGILWEGFDAQSTTPGVTTPSNEKSSEKFASYNSQPQQMPSQQIQPQQIPSQQIQPQTQYMSTANSANWFNSGENLVINEKGLFGSLRNSPPLGTSANSH